jgi:hypothetical protein
VRGLAATLRTNDRARREHKGSTNGLIAGSDRGGGGGSCGRVTGGVTLPVLSIFVAYFFSESLLVLGGAVVGSLVSILAIGVAIVVATSEQMAGYMIAFFATIFAVAATLWYGFRARAFTAGVEQQMLAAMSSSKKVQPMKSSLISDAEL